jgi:hypothetical protein
MPLHVATASPAHILRKHLRQIEWRPKAMYCLLYYVFSNLPADCGEYLWIERSTDRGATRFPRFLMMSVGTA